MLREKVTFNKSMFSYPEEKENRPTVASTTSTPILKDPNACSDPVVEAVVQKFRSRSQTGVKKYGMTLEGNLELGSVDWINHTIEELMDAINYLEKLKRVIEKHG